MKHRAWLVATFILVLSSGVMIWSWTARGSLHPPSPVSAGQPAPDFPPTTTSFGIADALPGELSDQAFWKMVSEFSEPGGYFQYENFLSNERTYQDVIPALKKTANPGGVYLGVGPEQNFTYIATIRPQMAFIIDIRRQNLLEHLMYKALFEMSANRAEFVSLLFSRKRPNDLDESSTAEALFQSYAAVAPDRRLFGENLRKIKGWLVNRHGFGLTGEDERTIDHVYKVFFSLGLGLSYSSVDPAPTGPTYQELMTIADVAGQNWSYLAREENFRFVKEMQRKNAIVPLVGDFAGVKAIRTLGRYLKDHNATVTAFYLSNVEMYILPISQWRNFCRNIAALPVDSSSTFIRFVVGRYSSNVPQASRGFLASLSVLSPMSNVAEPPETGYAPSYYDLLHASR
ncbi:MAG TPA: hypothetical protein VE422_46945 [Terriglobia bacterium]|nr:hypothetical protein [Terriglobia bacterium]